MTSLRSAGSYAGEAGIGGGGAAAFAAQVFNGGATLLAKKPSDAIVDVEGVRGKPTAVALIGIGLSRTCSGGAGKRPGSPVEISYTLWGGDILPVTRRDWLDSRVLLFHTTSLESRKMSANFFVPYGSGRSSFSKGTPSSKTTLLTTSGLSQHSSKTRA